MSEPKLEIERRFLVHADRLPDEVRDPKSYKVVHQLYLSKVPAIRLRVEYTRSLVPLTKSTPPRLTHCMKSGTGVVRTEQEIEIETMRGVQGNRRALIDLVLNYANIIKHRHVYGRWELDRFLRYEGKPYGLWLAEIELSDADEEFERPRWLGDEVTDDISYTNASLAGL